MYSRILCCVSARFFNIPTLMLSIESRRISSGTFSQDSQRCSSVIMSMIYWVSWDKHQQLSQEEFHFMWLFNDISCDRNDNKDECLKNVFKCLKNANYVKTFAGRFGIGQWSFIGTGSEKKSYSSKVHKEPGTILRSICCWNMQKVDILFSVQRFHCPGVFSRSKGLENCLYISLQIKTQLIQFIALCSCVWRIWGPSR